MHKNKFFLSLTFKAFKRRATAISRNGKRAKEKCFNNHDNGVATTINTDGGVKKTKISLERMVNSAYSK